MPHTDEQGTRGGRGDELRGRSNATIPCPPCDHPAKCIRVSYDGAWCIAQAMEYGNELYVLSILSTAMELSCSLLDGADLSVQP